MSKPVLLWVGVEAEAEAGYGRWAIGRCGVVEMVRLPGSSIDANQLTHTLSETLVRHFEQI